MFKNKFKNYLVFLILLAITLVGFKYRHRGYEYFPPVSSNFDEQVIVWSGSSLINNGVPTSWSFLTDYKSSNFGHLVKIDGWGISYDGKTPNIRNYSSFPKPLSHDTEFTLDKYTTQFTMVQPHIEQPPLAGLLSSFLSGTYKKPTFEATSISDIRIPVVILSSLATILVFLICFLTFKDLKISLFSSLIYSLTPTLVISQRLATAENYLTIFYLIGVVFTQIYIKTNKIKYLLTASVLVLICYLTKPFGISLALVIIFSILHFKKPIKNIVFPLAGATLGMILFFGYGYCFGGKELLTHIVSAQTNRLTSPFLGIFKIVIPRISSEIFLDGWIIFGWLSVLRSHFWVITPVVSYLLVLFLYGGEDYGWYRLPIYPFLSIAISYILIEIIRKKEVLPAMLFLMTAFATSLYWGMYTFDWLKNAQIFRILILVILALLSTGLFTNKKFRYVFESTLIILIIFSLYLNIQTVNNMNLIWPNLKDITSIIPMRH